MQDTMVGRGRDADLSLDSTSSKVGCYSDILMQHQLAVLGRGLHGEDIKSRLLHIGHACMKKTQLSETHPYTHIKESGVMIALESNEVVITHLSNFAGVKRPDQSVFVDHSTPGHVDDPDTILHLCEGLVVEDLGRRRYQRHVEGDEVGSCDGLVERNQLYPEGTGPVGRGVGIMSYHVHPKPFRSPRYL